MDKQLFFHSAYPKTQRAKRKGRVTVAAILEDNGLLKFGLTHCDFEDNFSRKQGRDDALVRAASDSEYIYTTNIDKKPGEITITTWFRGLASAIANLALQGKIKVNVPIVDAQIYVHNLEI